ncbi:MAG: chromosomal replication initiator protein DnaA [Acidobacteriota bacterium]|nr:chromosomal replication initiator protein DnaA [Acidobacteriota bacterium]
MSSFGTATPNPWTRVLDALEKKVNRTSYETWLKPTRFDHSQGAVLFVRVPSADFCHIGERYGDLISEAIDDMGLPYQDVEFVTEERQGGNGKAVRAAEARQEAPAPMENPVTGPAQQQRFDWDGAAQLNPKYTFDDFVIGAGNQFAHAAALAVGERPSKAYNPLFLYGGVGMGKTHLMQAIGHEIKKRQPDMSICYVSSERFTNDMINALRYSKMTSFRERYRNIDVLLVDDIQFLVNKERTQEEFFHTFNALHECMRQIVIASDRPPKELAEIEDRLRSRFEWGLIADIQPPDLETKVAILQKKAETENVVLPTDVALFIASNIRSNVRELEGALIRFTACASLTGRELNLQTAQDVLKNLLDSQVRKISIESIQKAVCEQLGLRLVEIKAKNNSRSVVFPRQIAMYLAKQLTDASLPEIGRQFGGKHHTTVLHSVEKITELRKTDKDLNRLLNKLAEGLGQ